MAGLQQPVALMGMVGDPVAENPIDQMFNAIFDRFSLHMYFVKIHLTEPGELQTVLAGAQAMGFAGLGITVPYKQDILALLDEIDDHAAGVGACNYVTFEDGKTIGHQTDGIDGVDAILRVRPLAGARVLLLGAGGAARGLGAGLVDAGVGSIVVAARRSEPGEGVAEMLRARGVSAAEYLPWHGDLRCPADVDVVLNATSAGAAPDLTELAIDWTTVPKRAVAVDLVTGPRNTPFIRAAHEHGLPTVDGADMLVEIGTNFCDSQGLPDDHALVEQIVTGIAGTPVRTQG